MSIIPLVVLGIISGFLASKRNKTGEGLLLHILLGVVGAVVGGSLYSMFGMGGVTGLNVYSFVVAIVGPPSFCSYITALSAASHDRVIDRSGHAHTHRLVS